VKKKGLLFLEDEEWIFLAPANYFVPRPPYSQEDAARAPKQHSIKVETRLDPAKEMSEEQAKNILSVIKREARCLPFLDPKIPGRPESSLLPLTLDSFL